MCMHFGGLIRLQDQRHISDTKQAGPEIQPDLYERGLDREQGTVVQEVCRGQGGTHDDQLQGGGLALLRQLAPQGDDARQQACKQPAVRRMVLACVGSYR